MQTYRMDRYLIVRCHINCHKTLKEDFGKLVVGEECIAVYVIKFAARWVRAACIPPRAHGETKRK